MTGMSLRSLVSGVRSLVAGSDLGMTHNDAWLQVDNNKSAVVVRCPPGKAAAVKALLRGTQATFILVEK